MKNDYTLKDLKHFGFKTKILQQWVRMDFIKPSIFLSHRQGVSHVWSRSDVAKLFAFQHLIDVGFTRRLASDIIHRRVREGAEHVPAV